MSDVEAAGEMRLVRLSRSLNTRLEAWSGHRLFGPAVRLAVRRREQLLYLAVGGWNTLFGYALWALMQYLLGDHVYYLVILLLAWFPAVLNAYFCYRYLVFRSRGRIRWELPRFSVVYAVTLCINLVALPVLLRVLPFSIYVTQVLFTAVVVVLSYLSHKYFSFRSGGGAALAPQATTRRADESREAGPPDIETASRPGRRP
jgi:putative flippase GtrA